MSLDQNALATLVAKDQIRELGLLYSRGVDRKDGPLLRDLYTADATDTHGDTFDGSAEDYVTFLENSFKYLRYSGHHICNHLISVDGDTGEGEVYALAYHVFQDGKGGWIKDLRIVRYVDRYRKEADGRWRFAQRVVTYDVVDMGPYQPPENWSAEIPPEPTYEVLKTRLFARGARG